MECFQKWQADLGLRGCVSKPRATRVARAKHWSSVSTRPLADDQYGHVLNDGFGGGCKKLHYDPIFQYQNYSELDSEPVMGYTATLNQQEDSVTTSGVQQMVQKPGAAHPLHNLGRLCAIKGVAPPYGSEPLPNPDKSPEHNLVDFEAVKDNSADGNHEEETFNEASQPIHFPSLKLVPLSQSSKDANAPEEPAPSKPGTVRPRNASWAKIAADAVRPAAVSKPHPTKAPATNPSKSILVAKPRAESLPTDVQEDLPAQMRVVWITNLRLETTMLDVSACIDIGPLMSLHLSTDNTTDPASTSACLVFQHAELAMALLARGPARFACLNKPPHPPINLFASTIPFPLDPDLASMSAPRHARRRLKWSRARLFYTVTLARFKADVRRVAGASNVELVHFYNPGEATAVFASVRVASAVLRWFEERARSVGSVYEGLGVAFAHDFNETPAVLFSQYSREGRVKKTATNCGVEGLFSGPP